MTATRGMGKNSFVLLHIGEHRFALSASLVAELAPPVRLHQFPCTSTQMAGVIVRRGKIVPVYNPSPLFGRRRSSSNSSYLIAACDWGGTNDLCAVPLNGECELMSGEIECKAAGAPDYVSGTLSVGEDKLDVLDLNVLVGLRTSEPRNPVAIGGKS